MLNCFVKPTSSCVARVGSSSLAKALSSVAAQVDNDEGHGARRFSKKLVLPKFEFFPHPKELVPALELSRKCGSFLAQTAYQIGFENAYSKESLLRGANDGISLIGMLIADSNFSRLSSVAIADLTELAQEARERNISNLNLLRFSTDDVVCSFLHSCLVSGKKIFKLNSSGNVAIYFTVVSFVRLNDSVPRSISINQASSTYRNDVLATNITLARTLNPLGPWKATSFNFFTLAE